MKIKLNKSQWENIGKTAGWIKQAEIDENVIPVEQILGTSPSGMNEEQIDADMHAKGYFLFREHYHFGKTLSYQNKKGDKVYLYTDWTGVNPEDPNSRGKSTWVTWEQLKENMRKEWRPQGKEEQDWFRHNLGTPIYDKDEHQPIPQSGNFGANPFN